MKGVPVRIAIGVRDLEKNVVEVARRDDKSKMQVSTDGLATTISVLLNDIQSGILKKAKGFRDENIYQADTWEDFEKLLDGKGGFISAHWDGTPATEDKIKELTKATIRCIPLNNRMEQGACVYSGQPSDQRVLFARAY